MLSKENWCMPIQYVAYLKGSNKLLSFSHLMVGIKSMTTVSCGRFKVKVKVTLYALTCPVSENSRGFYVIYSYLILFIMSENHVIRGQRMAFRT